MKNARQGGRALKRRVFELLKSDDFESTLEQLNEFPARQVINPLFSFLLHRDEQTRWRAITAMGVVVAALANTDMESARVVVRRCMWNLNDESGGIGWGCPEAMGDMMARQPQIAAEYACILNSYVVPHGNYLEHEVLQRGVLWGLARVSEVTPELVADTAPFLVPFLVSQDPIHRGLAAIITGAIQHVEAQTELKKLADDKSFIMLYTDLELRPCMVGQLANEALIKLSS